MDEIEAKVNSLRKLFNPSLKDEERYLLIIDLGRKSKTYPEALKIPLLQVAGCQSTLYLSSTFRDGRLFFEAHSDALISAGLAALLIAVYGGQTPEAILKTPPDFLGELGIIGSLSPSRSNGLAQIHLRIKRDALNILVLSSNHLDMNSTHS